MSVVIKAGACHPASRISSLPYVAAADGSESVDCGRDMAHWGGAAAWISTPKKHQRMYEQSVDSLASTWGALQFRQNEANFIGLGRIPTVRFIC